MTLRNARWNWLLIAAGMVETGCATMKSSSLAQWDGPGGGHGPGAVAATVSHGPPAPSPAPAPRSWSPDSKSGRQDAEVERSALARSEPDAALPPPLEGSATALAPLPPGASTASGTPVPTGPALTLEQVIQTAATANPDLRSATARIQLADRALARARAEFFPKLSVGEFYGLSNIPAVSIFFLINQERLNLSENFNHPGFVGNFSTYALLQHRLYAGGLRVAEAEAAEDKLAASNLAQEAARNELVFRAAETYYRLLQARELVESRAAAVRQVERHLALVESRFRAGTAVESDVLTVQVRLAEVREGLIVAQNNLLAGWALLENVTGGRFGECALPEGVPSAPWTARTCEIEAAIAAAMRRPELAGSARDISAAQHGVEAARSGKRPTVDFIGAYSTFSINATSGGNGLFVGLIAQMTIFDGHRTKAQVEQACARVRELQANHQRLMLDIELEARQSYLQLTGAEATLKVASQAVGQAEASLREIESRYRGQSATVTQLIDAQVAVSNAQVRRANAQADVEIAKAAIERTLGGLAHML